MFVFSSSSTGENTEPSTSSGEHHEEFESGDGDEVLSDDGSASATNPSFQLPSYLSSSPSSTPTRDFQPARSNVRASSFGSSSSSSSSSAKSPPKDQEDSIVFQRLVFLAKHPCANEAQVNYALQRKVQKEDIATAVAMKKGNLFRQQQQLQEARQRRSMEKKKTSYNRPSPPITSLIQDSSSEEYEEVDVELQQQSGIIFEPPRHCSKSKSLYDVNRRKYHSYGDMKGSSSFVVWQADSQVSSKRTYQGTPTPQRITFKEEALPRHLQNPQEEELHHKKRKGILGFAISMFGKIFPTEPAGVRSSSGASVLSDSLDGRSVNTANKSLASKASHQSRCSETTRKASNLSSKRGPESNMNRIDEEGRDDRRSGFRRMISSRNGIILLILVVVLIAALIVTVAAAFNGQDKDRQQEDSLVGDDHSLDSAPAQTPGGQPAVLIPTMSPKDDVSIPTTSNPSTTPLAPPSPTQSSITLTPPPTVAETLEPTTSPTNPPSVPPSVSPTVDIFSEWTWTQRGLSFKGNESGERFGQSVAISDDGKIVAIGAPYSTIDGKELAGVVQLYKWDDDDRRGWIPHGTLQGRNKGDQFGSNIALSNDGTIIAVSEPTFRGSSGDRSGNVRVFVHNPFNGYSTLGQELQGIDATDHFGIGLSISADGMRLAVGAPYHDNTVKPGNNGNGNNNNRLVSGHARVFEWSAKTSSWIPIGAPLSGVSHLDWFGWSVDLTNDGSIVCVGAPRNLVYGGYVQCFEEEDPGSADTKWNLLGGSIHNAPNPARYDDNFGSSVKVSWDATGTKARVAIGSPGKNRDSVDAGAAVVYELDIQKTSPGWNQLGQAIFSPSVSQDNQLATSLDIKGDLLAVGVPGAGEVNVFRFQGENSQWERHPRTLQGLVGSNFGTAVRLTSTGNIVVGSPQSGEYDDTGTVNVYNTGRS